MNPTARQRIQAEQAATLARNSHCISRMMEGGGMMQGMTGNMVYAEFDALRENIIFGGSRTSQHSLDLTVSTPERVLAHWIGYAEAAKLPIGADQQRYMAAVIENWHAVNNRTQRPPATEWDINGPRGGRHHFTRDFDRAQKLASALAAKLGSASILGYSRAHDAENNYELVFHKTVKARKNAKR